MSLAFIINIAISILLVILKVIKMIKRKIKTLKGKKVRKNVSTVIDMKRDPISKNSTSFIFELEAIDFDE